MDKLLGPRVEHLIVDQPGLLSDIVAEALELPKAFVLELLRFGAIFCSAVPPPMNPEASRKDLKRAVPRRALQDVAVPRRAYVRVHVHPIRYPAAYTTDWKARIVSKGAGYVVVDKPAGVPVVHSTDNVIESSLTCVAQALGEEEPLRATHRLDTCTSGLAVLGRTQEFVAAFNRMLRSERTPRPLRKLYRSLSASEPPLGTLVHWAAVGTRRLGWPDHTLLHADSAPGRLRCELEVLTRERVRLGPGAAAAGWAPAEAWEAVVELRTGRTHQIRAQLAACGAPLLGDTLYQRLAPCAAARAPADEAWRLEVTDCQGLFGEVGTAVFEASLPWWRDE
ncbi:hypothetical protein WJX81_002433 [Elliptochloris bilobata]|uniref:Pseudouridine synthase RsuA/RluA-like domain-containing protein n=1 Tax=Elliptochloris bilobata TaxID=381761 RepID=A0AAW1RBF6_9CHLO